MSELRRFFEEVSAPGSYRFIALGKPGVKQQLPYHVPAQSIDEMVGIVGSKSSGKNTYFTHGSFARGRWEEQRADGTVKKCVGRREVLAEQAKSFCADVDFKDHYQTAEEAIAAMGVMCRRLGIPGPTWIVLSGGGVHFWWCCTEPVPVATWKSVASAFKAAMQNAQFRFDPTCTDDVARLMRVPWTYNLKPDRGGLLAEGHRVGDLIPFGVMQAALKAYIPTATSPGRAGTPATSASQQTLSARLTEAVAEQTPRTPPNMAIIVTRCAALQATLASNGAGQTEPMWKDVLSVAAHCVDPTKWAHELSKGHIDYAPADTDAKLAERQQHKPTTCANMMQHEPFSPLCAACMYRGTASGVKSPVALGYDRNPLAMPGFDVKADGTVLRAVNVGSKEEPAWEYKPLVAAYKLRDFRMNELENGPVLEFEVEHRNRVERQHLTVRSVTADKRTFLAELSRFMSPPEPEREPLMRYFGSWIEEVRNTERHRALGDRLGFLDSHGRRGFSLGDRIIWQDGQLETLTRSSQHAGTFESWKLAAAELLKAPPELQAVLGLSFGAPLASWFRERAAMVSFYGDTGAGKSSAMRTGAAVWAEPTTFMLGASDTVNAVNRRLTHYYSLPGLYDDLATGRDPRVLQALVDLVFQQSTGREKHRLTANAGEAHTGTFATMLACATNARLIEVLGEHARLAQAIGARVLEIPVPSFEKDMGPGPRAAFTGLDRNYGVAGEMFARWFWTHLPQVEEWKDAITAFFNASCPDPKGEKRFLVTAAVYILLGQRCMLEVSGFSLHYLPAVAQVLIDAVNSALDASTERGQLAQAGALRLSSPTDASKLLANAMNALNAGIVIVNDADPTAIGGAGLTNHLGAPLRGQLHGQRVLVSGRTYLNAVSLRKWAMDNGHSPQTWFSLLAKLPSYRGRKYARLGNHVHAVTPAWVECLIFEGL